jgi:hypothetical protein
MLFQAERARKERDWRQAWSRPVTIALRRGMDQPMRHATEARNVRPRLQLSEKVNRADLECGSIANVFKRRQISNRSARSR